MQFVVASVVAHIFDGGAFLLAMLQDNIQNEEWKIHSRICEVVLLFFSSMNELHTRSSKTREEPTKTNSLKLSCRAQQASLSAQ